MDLLDIKERIGLALVESVFRRAGFTVQSVGPIEVPPHLGRDDLPDFAVRPPAGEAGAAVTARLVEVRYRLDVRHYLAIESQRGPRSMFVQAKRHWPELLCVFVTDHPESAASCFQALDLGAWQPGAPLHATDLFGLAGLGIFRQNVEEHEALLRRMFALLTKSP